MIEVLLLLIFAGVTYSVAGEGAWGAAITCVSTILAGLIALNFFEPICNSLLGSNYYWQARLDLIVLVGLFAAAVAGLRAGADYFSPVYIGVHRMVHEVARWGCGLLAGYVTMAFLLTALHTAPLGREFIGFKPERPNFFGLSPDRQWLGFMQWTTERVFCQSPARIFDGPVVALGDQKAEPKPVPNTVWPSFPIRYATRRERGAGMAATATQTPIRPVAPPKAGGPGF
ncbi:MAG: CvpA family protein [Planctomycetaceae bacterium]